MKIQVRGDVGDVMSNLEKAIKVACSAGQPVSFEFNGQEATIYPSHIEQAKASLRQIIREAPAPIKREAL